jgi:hypothetical protein
VDRSELRRLYERLIRQLPYPGAVCPTETTMSRYIAGEMSGAEYDHMKAHLAECSECRSTEELVRAVSAAFVRDRGGTLTAVLERAFCPPASVWAVLARSAESAGTALLARLEEHRAICGTCRRSAEAAARAEQVVRLEAKRALILLTGLASAAAGRRSRRSAAAGTRSGAAPAVSATLRDRNGQLLTDALGQVRTVRFEIIRAEAGEDGVLSLHFASADREVLAPSSGVPWRAECVVIHDDSGVRLEPQPVDARGRVSFGARLPAGKAVSAVPAEALLLNLSPAT